MQGDCSSEQHQAYHETGHCAREEGPSIDSIVSCQQASIQQRSALSLHGMVWYGMVWYGMVWYGMVWYGMVWYGMVWYGMVWYGPALPLYGYQTMPCWRMPMNPQATNLLHTRFQQLLHVQLWLQLRAAKATNLWNRLGVA